MRVKTQTFLLFFCFTSIGTFLHECGHALAAIACGLNAVIHYGWTTFIAGNHHVTEADGIVMSLAGPFVNMLIGSIGFLLLYRSVKRETYKNEILLAAISFFWSREIVVLVFDLLIKITGRKARFLSDEQNVSRHLFDSAFVFPVLLGVVGIFVCATTVFYLLRKENRLPFIVFGLLGSAAGYLFWFRFLGPVLLP